MQSWEKFELGYVVRTEYVLVIVILLEEKKNKTKFELCEILHTISVHIGLRERTRPIAVES